MASIEIPGYEIFEQLGRGGMATVYRALHMNLDREVALKVIDTNTIADESFSERFIREARISARLSHPHILQIYDVNLYGSLNYISMELLKGGDLEDIIRGAMTQRSIYQVMAQMTAALDYAADKGYVHRDIKPSNIMMRHSEDFVLADFGIAKAANSSTQMTQAGLLVGTPSYMSPEQAGGTPLDGRSDLYSLAVVCYEMLTKVVPYESDSAVSTAVKHLTEKIPRLPKHLAAYQPFLDKALAKNPDDRFQSGREMYQAFCEMRDQFSDEDVLTAPTTPARPTPTSESALEDDDDHTVALWSDPDQIGDSPTSTSNGAYKLHPGHSSDNLLSGIRNEREGAQTAAKKSTRSGGGLKAIAAVLVLGVAAGGGVLYWQQQRAASPTEVADAGQTARLQQIVAEADAALEGGNLPRARELVDEGLEIDRGYPPLGKIELALVTAEQVEQLRAAAGNVQEVQRVTEQNVQLLLNTGDEYLEAGDIAAAGERYVTARGLAPEREGIQERITAAAEALTARAREAVASGSFDAARADIEAAASLAPDAEAVASLQAELPGLEAQYELDLRFAEASEQLAAGNISEAAASYIALLEADPDSPQAAEGLAAAADAMVESARQDARSARFSRAEEKLAAAIDWVPEHPEASALAAEIPGMRATWQEEQTRLAEREAAAQELASTALRAAADKDLATAQTNYRTLLAEYAEMPVTDDVRRRLRDGYAEAARQEIQLKAWDAAQDYISQGRSIAPDASLWAELDEELELSRSSDRRRLGAY